MKESTYKNYDDLPLFLNAAMVAQVLGVAPSSAYELMHEKDFPTLRVGSRMVVPKEKFIEWVEQHMKGGRGHHGDDCLPAPQKQGLKFLIKYPRPGEVYFVGSGVLPLFEDGITRPSRRRACRRRGSKGPCVSMAAADGRSAGTCYTENAESAQRT